jgi:hypothetical protein
MDVLVVAPVASSKISNGNPVTAIRNRPQGGRNKTITTMTTMHSSPRSHTMNRHLRTRGQAGGLQCSHGHEENGNLAMLFILFFCSNPLLVGLKIQR